MKTNWLIIMLLAGVAANAQVYIGSKLDGRPAPGVALQVESSSMGIQFPVINLTNGQTLDQVFPASANIPEGSMVYVQLDQNYQANNETTSLVSSFKKNGNGFYVKTTTQSLGGSTTSTLNENNLKWEFSGVIEEEFINNQVVNEFVGYSIQDYQYAVNNPGLSDDTFGFDLVDCVKNTETSHTYCIYKDNEASAQRNKYDWDNAYNLAKNKGGYLMTITSQKEYDFVLNNVLNYNKNNIKLIDKSFKTWMGFTTYIMDEYKDGTTNKTDVNSGGTTYSIGNLKYLWITGEEFLMDWENSTKTGALVETNKYYNESTFYNTDVNKTFSAYLNHTSNMTTNSLKSISALENLGTSDFKYIIVEYTN